MGNVSLFLGVIFINACSGGDSLFKGKTLIKSYDGETMKPFPIKLNIGVPGFGNTEAADTFLLAFTPFNQKGLLSVSSANSGKLLCKDLILKGRGPGEFLNIDYVDSQIDSGEVKIWLGANGYRKLVCLNLTGSLKESRPVIEQEIPCGPGAAAGVLDVFRATEDSLLLFRYEPVLKNFKVTGLKPGDSGTDSGRMMFNREIDITAGSGSPVYHPAHPYLVTAYLFFNRIYYFSPDGRVPSFSVCLKDGEVSRSSYEQLQKIPQQEREIYYISSLAADRFLAFLYERKNKYFVQFWDWEGNILKVIELEHPAKRISYSSGTGCLYASDYREESVYKYDLSGLEFISR